VRGGYGRRKTSRRGLENARPGGLLDVFEAEAAGLVGNLFGAQAGCPEAAPIVRIQ